MVLSGFPVASGSSSGAKAPHEPGTPVLTPRSTPTASRHVNLPSEHTLAGLLAPLFQRPHLSTPSVSFVAGVAAFTNDPAVANNTGINTTITLPSTFTPPAGACYAVSVGSFSGQICAFLGVEEPLNATETIGVGVLLASVSALGTVAYPVGILPGSGNGSFVVDDSSTSGITLGESHTFSIVWSHGEWWNYEYDGQLLTGTSAGQNGTYLLNATKALGISGSPGTGGGLGSLGGGPAQALFELGNVSFTLPETTVPNAIGIEQSGGSTTNYQPVSGNAVLLNTNFTMGIEGHDQVSAIRSDYVIEGGSTIAFPGQFAPLWGDAHPLGIFTPQAAAYTTETAIGASSGLAFNVTLPATSSEAAGTAELLALQEPVTDSVTIAIGVEFTGTKALPFYAVRNDLAENTYVDVNDSLTLGQGVSFSVGSNGNEWWSFAANGVAIAQTSGAAAGNGSASLGSATAVGFNGVNLGPSSVLFSETTFPILALFGNGTMSSVNASVAIAFHLPGRGWMVPDFGLGYWWSDAFDVEGTSQDSHLTAGTVLLGSALPAPMSGNEEPLWEGALALVVSASPTTVYSGQAYNVSVNLTSGIAPPANPVLCGTTNPQLLGYLDAGCTVNFTLSRSSGNWALWVGTATALTLKSASSVTQWVNISASPTEPYVQAVGSTSVTVVPPTLVATAHASVSTVTAGGSAKIWVWVNNTLGQPVSGAFVNATAAIPGLGKTATAVSGTPGLYADTLTTSVSLAMAEHYNITFDANRSASVGGSSTVQVNVVPLALLVVSASFPSSVSGGIGSDVSTLLTVTVMANGSALAGTTVTILVSPGSPAWSGIIGPWVTGTNGETQWAMNSPNVTTKTTFSIAVNATASGYRPGNTTVSITVLPPSSSSPSSGSDTLLYVGIGVAVAVVAVVALLVMMRKKKPAPPGQDYANPPPQ